MKIKKVLKIKDGWLNISDRWDYDAYVVECKSFSCCPSHYQVNIECSGTLYHVCKCLSLKRAIKKAEKIKKWAEGAVKDES